MLAGVSEGDCEKAVVTIKNSKTTAANVKWKTGLIGSIQHRLQGIIYVVGHYLLTGRVRVDAVSLVQFFF